MRKRIVSISMDIYPTKDDINGMRAEFNAMGIDPLFISAGVKVLEPEKKTKRHRLIRKKRCKNYEPLKRRFESAKVISGENRLRWARNLIGKRNSWGVYYILDICSHIYRRHGSGNSGLCLSNKLMRRGLLKYDIQSLSDDYSRTIKQIKIG